MLVVLVALFLCSKAFVLDFDPSVACDPVVCTNGASLSQNYGDEPGIDVSYRSITVADVGAVVTPVAASFARFWSTGYLVVSNVGYGGTSFAAGLQLTFEGSVTVQSFLVTNFQTTAPTSQVTVLDRLTNQVLFSSGAIQVVAPHGIVIQLGPDGYNVAIDNVQYFASGSGNE